MLTVDIHEAKIHLARLIEAAAKGESFIIAKAGKPMVKVVALDTPIASQVQRLGFMADEIEVRTTSIRCARSRSRRCSRQASEILLATSCTMRDACHQP